MKDNIYYSIGALLAMFMAFMGVYGMIKIDIIHGVILFGLGLYLSNILAIGRIIKQIDKNEGGEE